MSSNQISRIIWDRIAVTHQPVDLQDQAVAFDGAASSGWPDAAAPSAAWASTLIRACACGRIGSEVMWDILLAHVDADTPPDVSVLLEHLPEAHARASLNELLDAETAHQARLETTPTYDVQAPRGASEPAQEHEDWFVMVENLGAA